MVYLVSDIDNVYGKTRKYILTNVSVVNYTGNTEPVIISIPEMEEPIVFNFGGRKNRIRIDWYIVDSEVDLSDGTASDLYSGGVYTIKEQIDYLESKFITADVGTTVKIVLDEIDGREYAGVSAGFNWSWNGGEKRVRASLSIIPSIIA